MFALTRRLTLRPGWPEDAPALARAIGHEAVVRNLARAPWPYALGDAEFFLSLPRDGTTPIFQIVERHGAYRLVGGIALLREEEAWELGYWLTPEVWGRGYATEAGRAVVAIARDTLRLPRLRARYYRDNPASGRVLAKLGFREIGTSRQHSLGRGGHVDCVEMSLDLADEEAPRAAMPMAA